jgi:hypothetical protein
VESGDIADRRQQRLSRVLADAGKGHQELYAWIDVAALCQELVHGSQLT